MTRLFSAGLLALTVLPPAALFAQSAPKNPFQTRPAQPLKLPAPGAPTAAPAQPAKKYAELKPYGSCDFPDGLQVSDVSPMPDDVHERPVQMHGITKSVPLLAGQRVLFAYPGAQPYANAKIELLPAENFAANRKLLMEDFDDIIASDKNVARDTTRKPQFNGFSIVGMNRNELKTNTLGIYLLIDDQTHVATTVYLLNPAQSRFKTTSEYARMRDTFLYNYTRCIRNNQIGTTFGVSK